jgi:hypothetical protein
LRLFPTSGSGVLRMSPVHAAQAILQVGDDCLRASDDGGEVEGSGNSRGSG